MNIPKKKLLSMAKEECESSEQYKRLGLKSFAKDEAKHCFILKKMAEKK